MRVARKRASTNESRSDASLVPRPDPWAGFSVVIMNLSLLALDHQKPTEPWSQELEWLALIFFDGDIGTEKRLSFRPV